MTTWKGQQGRWRVNPVWEAGKEEGLDRSKGQVKQVEEKSGKQEGLCLATARLLPGKSKGGGK